MSLALWSQRRAAGEGALGKLARMPLSETGHGVAVPMPYRDKAGYKGKHSNEEINERIEKARVVMVPIEGLHAIQHSVKPERVEQYLRDPHLTPTGAMHEKAGTPVDHPIVIQQDGVRFLHDGHHRTVARWLSGERKVPARLVNFDE